MPSPVWSITARVRAESARPIKPEGPLITPRVLEVDFARQAPAAAPRPAQHFMALIATHWQRRAWGKLVTCKNVEPATCVLV